jgi:hypothetical protein
VNHLNKHSFCYKSTLQDALSWYTYDAVHIISTKVIAKRKIDWDDRGAFTVFQELMHSWVWYKLVKVLLIFGLSPKIRNDLENWSLDLFHLFSYMGDNQRDQKNKEGADCLLTILFHKTLVHSGYFGKLPFGSKDKFEKMPNTILPLVVLTWLRQLQEYFYEIGDNKESGDSNVHGKYCAIKARHVSKDFPLDNMHMMKANSTSVVKVDSVTYIKPDGKHYKIVVKSLEEWAAKIICWNNDYVQNIAKLDDKTKRRFKRTETHGSTQYAMSETSYKPANEETCNTVNIVKFTPEQQQHKTPEQLLLHVSNFMKDKIKTLTQKSSKEKCEPKRHQIAQQCK